MTCSVIGISSLCSGGLASSLAGKTIFASWSAPSKLKMNTKKVRSWKQISIMGVMSISIFAASTRLIFIAVVPRKPSLTLRVGRSLLLGRHPFKPAHQVAGCLADFHHQLAKSRLEQGQRDDGRDRKDQANARGDQSRGYGLRQHAGLGECRGRRN